jgi:tetratricopeptide (TPR) repeat protein
MSIQSILLDKIASTELKLDKAPHDFMLRQELVTLLIKSTDMQKALEVILKAYELHGKDDAVLLLHIKWFMLQGQYREAKNLFTSLPEHCFQNPNTLFNYAYSLDMLRQSRLAISVLQKYMQMTEAFTKCVDLYARLLDNTDQSQAALAFLERFIETTGSMANSLLITRTNALRSVRDLKRAEESASELVQTEISSLMCLAGVHYDKQDFEATIEVLWKIIALEIDNIPAHEFLNKVFWESNDLEHFLTSYDKMLAHIPTHLEMQSSKLQMQIIAQQYDEALNSLQKIPRELISHPMILHISSVVYTRLKDDLRAQAALDQCLKIEPQNPRFLIDKAVYHIRQKQYNSANTLLLTASKLDPFNQEALAYIGTVWKLAKSEHYHWLYNYPHFVSQENIQQAYVDKLGQEDAWQKLTEYCRGLHGEINNPLDQSVRKGTQTTGKVLSSEHILMDTLKQQITESIKAYLGNLPSDPNHPFLQRKSDDFYLSGNWSVRLYGSGHHVNHVHPKGWLSACLYIQVPKSTTENDPDKKGWLTFGQSGLEKSEENSVDQYVCPAAGKLVLFPAYFWHGTVPTNMTEDKDGERITIICDIEPLYTN